ncbi:ABC transporter substrate-binding protein [Tardiphaga sp. vice352]|uniref:ABC transporter substrate-binding protein n=1 Tax=unclassified Tardiphaga TaxID=2631404 RepID=UPI001164CFBC|nr:MULTISPECIES: ABC transporter substrate-binding protein [unclassified Tardiphaga]QDM15261.1 ABC transporter substrate-binding protein [Tardiphaga sp. vice278]QDM20344.1 ABC transporter substrate-binding protein [Tardiphaga sp. vice154]QDM25430.1 ABC transporter substrate-binding protein [Tardiphaga sp. vice304]QDM30640.1 ABC transporter substrate-binding protein [Tardiphaga sp. vice352]
MTSSAPHLPRRLTWLVGMLLLAGTAPGRAVEPAKSPATIQFTLDRPIDAIAAPFVLANVRGLYRAENLVVSTNVAAGSKETIARVAAGASDMALADLNALIRYRDAADAAPVKAVFVLLNKAPYAVIARRSRGVTGLASLEGKTLGIADGDLAIRLWPALAKRNDIKPASVKQEKISSAVREPMLSAGQVDAVTGFSYASPVNLRDRGVPSADLAVFRFADYGSAAYGLAIVVNPKFAAEKPDAVSGFLRAVTAGTQLAIQQPDKAIDAVLAEMDNGTRELELERLRTVLADNILTDDVRRDGLGGIDATRFAAALDEIAEDHVFRKRPAAAEIFDGSHLPPLADRTID